jgi:uncharacterized Fe-S cluster protein YjdI
VTDEAPLAPTGGRHDGRAISVWYDPRRCTDVGECVRGAPAVFDLAAQPEPRIDPDADLPERIAQIVRRCPTGALHYRLADGTDEPAESPTRISLRPEGPIWVQGDLRIDTSRGPLVERRAALCGCGRSANRPWCDMACQRDAARP